MFTIIGVHLARAAWWRHPQYDVGVASARSALSGSSPTAKWALGSMAAGPMTYGLLQIAKEPFRRLHDS